MPIAPDLQAIAHEMSAAHAAATQVTPYSARPGGLTLPAAYEVAAHLHAARVAAGARPVGRKIGFTNADLWPVYGVHHPVWGWVYDGTLQRLDTGHGRCRLAGLAEPKIEPEIVFGLRAAPHAGDGLAALLGAIEWVAHGFEIVQSHYPGWHFQAADTVVDNGLHGRLLLGDALPLASLADPPALLQGLEVELWCDGELRERGRGAHVLGSPLRALAHLVDVLATQPAAAPLQAGEIVTTGTLTQAYPVRPGQTWSTRVHGIALPGLTVTFEG